MHAPAMSWPLVRCRRQVPDERTAIRSLSTRDPGPPIVVPAGRGVDDLGIQVGFPQTVEGALGQLASIDRVALESASLAGVRAVIERWALPGGPTAQTWSGVKAMASLLEDLGLSGAGSANLKVTATPAMGLIKGTVGQNFTVVCVDFAIDIQFSVATQTAAVDCQRMVWTDDGWMIGPGPEPALAPSVWPDTDAAIEAGYRDLEVGSLGRRTSP